MNDYFTDIDEVASQTDDYDIKDARTGKDDNNWDELYNSISQKKDNGDEGILKDLTKRVDEMAGAVKDTFGFADWQDKYQKKPEVKHLVILAERNSGLSWLYQKISDCYPQLKVSTSLVRPGFLFQTPKQALNAPTVILSLFVHPYTWVELMRKNPIYAPHHKDLPWQDFVAEPWNYLAMEVQEDLPIDATCQYDFKKNYIVPCKPKFTKEQDKPVYELELNGSGHAYSSIIDLRADKILNHIQTGTWENVTSHLTINYETLMRPGEFDKLLANIDKETGGTLNHCDTSLLSDYIAPSLTNNDGYDADYEYVKWMDDNLDWTVENMIGYHLDSYRS